MKESKRAHGGAHIRKANRHRITISGKPLTLLLLLAVAVIAIIVSVILMTRHADKVGDAAAPVSAPVQTKAPSSDVIVTAPRVSTPTRTAVPASGSGPAPIQRPGSAATVKPAASESAAPTATVAAITGEFPDVISFYQPEGKPYSPRVKMGDTFSAKWKKGEDIGSFEVIASEADRLPGEFFGDMFGAAWTSFADAEQCKIGYILRYTLQDGSEIQYTMLAPNHIKHTEYIECWLYDDYHREPHVTYSHIKHMKSDTLMTSIKLTCGKKIKEVQEIWLTAFVCSSLEDFDADHNYIGPTSCTLHITRS